MVSHYLESAWSLIQQIKVVIFYLHLRSLYKYILINVNTSVQRKEDEIKWTGIGEIK